MPKLIPTLTLSSLDVTSDSLNFSISDELTTKAPSVSLSTVIATATGSQTVIVPASTNISYLYVKHSGTTNGTTATTRQVDVEFTTDEAIARLSAGEFLFMPVHHAEADVGVQLHVQHSSSSDEVQLEYAYFTKG